MLNKILIVDDSEALHQNYKVTLKRYNCEILTALSREDGLKKLTENAGVNLIFVDMNMALSRMSGMEFIKKVKEQDAYAAIPLIIVTTRGKRYAEEAFTLADGNLIKPFTSNELHAMVEKIIARTASA